MNKTEFLNQLELLLKSLKKKERSKYLAYYSEMIEDAVEDGSTEEDAVKRIGAPGEIAQQILAEQEPLPVRSAAPLQKVLITVLLILGAPIWGSLLLGILCLAAGLALTVFMLLLSAYVVIWCLPFATGAVSIGCLLLAVVSMLGAPFLFLESAALGVTQFGIGIFSAGIFILFGFLTHALSARFVKVTIRFTKWLKALFLKWKRRIWK